MRVRICSLVTVETNFLPVTLQSFDSSVTAMINSLENSSCQIRNDWGIVRRL